MSRMPLRMHPKTAAVHVLHALDYASKASEGRLGFAFDMYDDDWESIGWCVRGAIRPTNADFVSDLSHDRYRLEYIVRLCETLKGFASKFLKVHEDALLPIVSKLSKGVAMLPNELLALIFKFATLDEFEGTRHAMMLSHVSRRFRQIVTEDRSLWSTLFAWYDTTNEGIQSCINRTGVDSDLHIVLNHSTDLNVSASYNLIRHCSAYASRWRYLTLIGDGEEWDNSTVGELLNEVMGKFDLKLPRLNELSFIERYRNNGRIPWLTRDTNFEYEPWWAPNVRILRCSEYIPPRSLPFEALTSFTLKLTLSSGNAVGQINYLRAFLRWTDNLLEMDIQLVDEAEYEDVLTADETVSLPSLTAFRFSLLRFDTPHALHRLPEPFLKTLETPNLNKFSLSTRLSEFPADLIPDPIVHPHLATFTLEMPYRRFIPRKDVPDLLDIPLHQIPNVSSLSVSTRHNKVAFSRAQTPDQAIPDGDFLRTLSLESCRNMDIESLREMVSSLKNVGAWDGIERIDIRACTLLDYDAVVEVLAGNDGEKELYFSAS